MKTFNKEKVLTVIWKGLLIWLVASASWEISLVGLVVFFPDVDAVVVSLWVFFVMYNFIAVLTHFYADKVSRFYFHIYVGILIIYHLLSIYVKTTYSFGVDGVLLLRWIALGQFVVTIFPATLVTAFSYSNRKCDT
ncbi:MAG: hypothetical protein PF795_15500 [Kiritimatiellae bacterium]|jgi:hypothetical protein|nr:hypothetical protein [Kiritimatiellia bacterium]